MVFGGIAAAGIYAIVDVGTTRDPLGLLDAILRGGVRVVQYRAKTGVDTSLLHAMLQRTRASGARLIVNDDLVAARAADGWHGGQEDLEQHDRSRLRADLGPGILGISCATPAEARDAEEAGADYVGVGPFAATSSKSDAGPAIGAAGIAAVVRSTRLPVVAIGGIHAGNLADVFASGALMAAVISAIASAPDSEAATRDLVDRWRALADRA